MDGTLVNSERFKGQALSEACLIFGGNVDVNVYKMVMGESWNIVTSHFFNSANIAPNQDEFDSEFYKIYKKLLIDNLALNPSAKELILELKDKNKKLGVVSSAAAWSVNQILNQLELSEYFDVVINGQQVVKHKPDPESYLMALEKLSLPASEVLIFEDSNAGLKAAKSANCDVIAFQHEFNSMNDLSLAMQVISDFKEVIVK
jgi:HAD superfamily hydrolase (TIGR01509 family)